MKGDADGFWFPLFLRDEDADFLQALLQRNTFAPLVGVKDVLQRVNCSILSVVLHSSALHPFLATIEIASGPHGRKELEVHYAEAIALAIQTHAPILIDQDITQQTTLVIDTESKKIRKEQKKYLNNLKRPKSKREKLQGQLQEAIQREDYELAASIRDELKILNEPSMENSK